MNLASLELCKELYELSGWKQTSYWHHKYQVDSGRQTSHWRSINLDQELTMPAYNLGYLLRELPPHIDQTTNELMIGRWGNEWRACYMPINLGHYPELREQAEAPEDALTKLAIELFKQGVLIREQSHA